MRGEFTLVLVVLESDGDGFLCVTEVVVGRGREAKGERD